MTYSNCRTAIVVQYSTVAYLRDPCPIGVHGLYALDAKGQGKGSLVDVSLEHVPRYVKALRPVDDRRRARADDLQRVETPLAVSVVNGVAVDPGGENAARGCGRSALRTPRQRSRRDGDSGERHRGRRTREGGGGKEHERQHMNHDVVGPDLRGKMGKAQRSFVELAGGFFYKFW